jgi:hypothetical protein
MAKVVRVVVAVMALVLAPGAWADNKAGVRVEPESITIVGTFHGVFGPVLTSDPARGGMGTITCDGKVYVLHFSGGLFTDELAKLDGKKVMLIGKPSKGQLHPVPRAKEEGLVVLVSEMPTVADGQAQEKAMVTIDTRLEYRELESNPPKPFWTVTVHGETWSVSFATPELRKLAQSLSGEPVRVTGIVEKGTLRVTALRPVGR